MPAPTGRTTNQLPFPFETDGVDPPRDIKALAEFLNTWEPPGTIPIGGEAEWAGKNDPNTKWLIEDGREVSRATYAALFAAIGTEYGAGNGTTTFNLPDTRGRVSIGAGQGASLTNRVRAVKFGEETHTLTVAELASHTHGPLTGVGAFHMGSQPGSYGSHESTEPPSNGTKDQATTAAEGSNVPHNNMQPAIVKNKIIRVL